MSTLCPLEPARVRVAYSYIRASVHDLGGEYVSVYIYMCAGLCGMHGWVCVYMDTLRRVGNNLQICHLAHTKKAF